MFPARKRPTADLQRGLSGSHHPGGTVMTLREKTFKPIV
jgi:hypothetical protein